MTVRQTAKQQTMQMPGRLPGAHVYVWRFLTLAYHDSRPLAGGPFETRVT
jgi:hypothetical protein